MAALLRRGPAVVPGAGVEPAFTAARARPRCRPLSAFRRTVLPYASTRTGNPRPSSYPGMMSAAAVVKPCALYRRRGPAAPGKLPRAEVFSEGGLAGPGIRTAAALALPGPYIHYAPYYYGAGLSRLSVRCWVTGLNRAPLRAVAIPQHIVRTFRLAAARAIYLPACMLARLCVPAGRNAKAAGDRHTGECATGLATCCAPSASAGRGRAIRKLPPAARAPRQGAARGAKLKGSLSGHGRN